jgi:DNA helicase-2/ATP-dependent DNA helicase PcrA
LPSPDRGCGASTPRRSKINYDFEANPGFLIRSILDELVQGSDRSPILEHVFESRGHWLDQLNDRQREAVTHQEGPLLVVAGAGSGKTLTLACRVAWLIAHGARPQRILLLTFTRRASRVMLGRARQLSGSDASSEAWGGTFHAVANRLLRSYGRAVGVHPDFTVLDQADAADLIDLIRGELDLGSGRRRFPSKNTLAAIYSRTVNAGLGLSDVIRSDFPWCSEEIEGIRSIFRSYAGRKRRQNVLDYDDLLLYWKALAEPLGGRRVYRLFDHILVDEYQDTNGLQAEILKGMWRGQGSLTAVGDDAQAIYSFRSATNRNILEFPTVFPGSRIVKLERNYRSTPPILDVSNAVIARSPQRHEKTMWTERGGQRRPALITCLDEAEQSDAVCRHLLEHRDQGVPLRRQSVLFRAAHHSDLLELDLTRRNIPFVKYGGLKFLESGHVKDVLALLRILENPFDEVSWFRVLQLLEDVGPATARRLMGRLGVRTGSGSQAPSPVAIVPERVAEAPAAARSDLARLGRALADCGVDGMPPAPQIERLRRFLEPIFERRYPVAASRLRDVLQLEQMASTYPSRGRFITDLTLDPPNSTGDLAGTPLLDEDYVILSTIHSAKGLEWDVVHVIHASDGMIPSDMATGSADSVEEERRLLYVALTRSREMLYVYFPLRYYYRRRGTEDGHAYGQLSRFLPPAIQDLFDRSFAGPGPNEAPASETPAVGTTAGRQRVEAILEELWEA